MNPQRALVFLRAAAATRACKCAVATFAAATQSIRWWRLSATLHQNAWAQTIVGDAYAAAGNFVHAARWWRRGFENGDAAAGTRLICLCRIASACSADGPIFWTIKEVHLQNYIPRFMEVNIPQIAVLWSVYFEPGAKCETSEAATGTQFDVCVSLRIDAKSIKAHTIPLLQNLELCTKDAAEVVAMSWVATPTSETAVVSTEFAAAFSLVHSVSPDVGALVHLESEIRPVPGVDAAELWVCATFDTNSVELDDKGGKDDASAIGSTEWALGGPHAQ